jgi:hypothetical protein
MQEKRDIDQGCDDPEGARVVWWVHAAERLRVCGQIK